MKLKYMGRGGTAESDNDGLVEAVLEGIALQSRFQSCWSGCCLYAFPLLWNVGSL